MNRILNITENMTPDAILAEAHTLTAVPSVLISYISFAILFLIVGLLFIDPSRGNKPYGKFMLIWFIATFISGAVAVFVMFSPNSVQMFADWWLKLFS